MSQAAVVNGEVGRNWGQEPWTASRDEGKPNTGIVNMTTVPEISTQSPQTTVKQLTRPTTPMTQDVRNEVEGSTQKLSKKVPGKRRESRFTLKKLSISDLADPSLVEPPKALVTQDASGRKSKSTSALSSLARRGSRMIHSRSPSPGHRRTPSTHVSKPEKAVVIKSDASFSKSDSTEAQVVKPVTRTLSFAKSGRAAGMIFTRSASTPQISTATGKFNSKVNISVDAVPEVPSLITPSAIQQFQNARVEKSRKRDELWNVFKTLEQDHAKFISKPNSFKASVLRTSLLPFLQQHANPLQNISIRAEDLDRRVMILNKWWTGLLDILTGRNGFVIVPSDRPAVLDALTGIMQRPEWRVTMTSLVLSRQNTAESTSSSSLVTSGSDFLAETVLNNTRSIFVRNLLSQVNFAVERMSLRTVAATVVAFCGRALAYAFLFCPGVAEVLIRLWNPQQTVSRRILDEYGIPRNTNLKSTMESVSEMFPKHLQPLCMTSLPSLFRALRERFPLTADLDHINWNGPWVGRWSGRDSDLFFSFTKYYHSLVCGILGEDATDRKRLCAPGAVLVYGQMLTVMDATIQVHKSPNLLTQAVTFDDVLGVDTSAAALSIKGVNAARAVGENRLIVLLREVLSNSTISFPGMKVSFAALFGNLLKAVTKRTRVNDGDACFMLCDFLEESMNILARFFRNNEDPMAFLDWPFWLDVLKKLGNSNNSMTEVRLHAFIYSLWGYITKDEDKKRDICLNWLLKEDYAYQQFNHWCPMVRAYYQRLLVWRVARCYGNPSQLDIEIYSTLLSLLQKMFNQYLSKLSIAEKQGTTKPSSVPASPAPGRRLLIIRDDSVLAPTATLATFLASSTDHATYNRLTSLETLNKLAENPDLTGKIAKKRFTFLRGLNPFGSVAATAGSSNSTSPQNSPPSSIHTPGDSTGVSTPESQSSRPSTPPTPTPELIPSRSFKFSLEWIERPLSHNKNKRLYPPRLPPSSQALVPRELAEAILVGGINLTSSEEAASRFVGVALAEWSILVVECAAFAERRRYEGVPYGREETPVLGVETFRKSVA